MLEFYIGVHEPSHTPLFPNCLISITRLRRRKGDFYPNHWLMDSGGFTELCKFQKWSHSVQSYANEIERWRYCGDFQGAFSQDWPCSPKCLQLTGLTIEEHQQRTIDRYDELVTLTDAPIIPVLQGQRPDDYLKHLHDYGDRLKPQMRVGVGSLVAASSIPQAIAEIIQPLNAARPDLRFHGLGIKLAAFKSPAVLEGFSSSDSMSWCFAARKARRNYNYIGHAMLYMRKVSQVLIEHAESQILNVWDAYQQHACASELLRLAEDYGWEDCEDINHKIEPIQNSIEYQVDPFFCIGQADERFFLHQQFIDSDLMDFTRAELERRFAAQFSDSGAALPITAK